MAPAKPSVSFGEINGIKSAPAAISLCGGISERMTGQRKAMASRTEYGRPSIFDVETNTSALLKYLYRVSFGIRPVRVIKFLKLIVSICFAKKCLSEPFPIMIRRELLSDEGDN